MADFDRWHGAEEVEHRHVSYDVAKYFGMDYFAQALSGMLVTVVVFLGVARHEVPCPTRTRRYRASATSGCC